MDSFKSRVRGFFSGDKIRYKAEGFDLDLSYITPRLIVLGLPATGVASIWRDSLSDVVGFLELHHKDHYKVFNLGKSSLQYHRAQPSSVWYSWPSKTAPPLEMMMRILNAIDEYLKQDPQNVAVILSKSGKERSGTVVASYLLYSGAFRNASEALDYFATKRSADAIGVSTPSMMRYVEYASLIRQPSIQPLRMYLRKIVMQPVPQFTDGVCPIVEVYDANRIPHELVFSSRDNRTFSKLEPEISLTLTHPVQGDTYIRILNRIHLLGIATTIPMFRFGFHSNFVGPIMVLRKHELDLDSRTGALNDERYPVSFFIEAYFTPNPTDPLPIPTSVFPTMPIPPRPTDVIPPTQFSQSQMQSTGVTTQYGPSTTFATQMPPMTSTSTSVTSSATPQRSQPGTLGQELQNATKAVTEATERLVVTSTTTTMTTQPQH